MLKSIIRIFLFLLPAFLFMDCTREMTTSYEVTKTESLSLLSPKGGERYSADKSIVIRWISTYESDSLRIELLNDNQSVYAVNNVQNSGHFIINIPEDVIPSDKYQIKILLMTNPEIFDKSQAYFEIVPAVNGHWYCFNVDEETGLELDLELADFIKDTFTGSGYFSFTYRHYGETITIEKQLAIAGIVSYPVISFVMIKDNSDEFNFTGKLITNSKISGTLIGYIDSNYGSLSDTLSLYRR